MSAEVVGPARPEVATSPALEALADSAGFLLSKLGGHVARGFRARLAPLGVEPVHVSMLCYLSAAEGQSQQTLCDALEAAPSRMVALLDDLEARGLAVRRRNPSNRRANALHLTPAGRELLSKAMGVAREYEADLLRSVDAADRRQLISLLRRLAGEQGIPIGVHPGLYDGGPC